jgi:hypothetical protein
VIGQKYSWRGSGERTRLDLKKRGKAEILGLAPFAADLMWRSGGHNGLGIQLGPLVRSLPRALGGHPKPATEGHVKTGHQE